MSDLTRYSKARSERDPEFAKGFKEGYANFKIGAMLRQAREQAGLTQEELAQARSASLPATLSGSASSGCGRP